MIKDKIRNRYALHKSFNMQFSIYKLNHCRLNALILRCLHYEVFIVFIFLLKFNNPFLKQVLRNCDVRISEHIRQLLLIKPQLINKISLEYCLPFYKTRWNWISFVRLSLHNPTQNENCEPHYPLTFWISFASVSSAISFMLSRVCTLLISDLCFAFRNFCHLHYQFDFFLGVNIWIQRKSCVKNIAGSLSTLRPA